MHDMRHHISSFFLLMLFLFLLFFVVFFLLFIPQSLAASYNCSFKLSCGGGEVGLLRAESYTGGYENAHAQLMSYGGTPYAYTLCCVADAEHTLDNDCGHENATIILRLSDTSNAHVQEPSVNTYGQSACMAGSPGNISCEYGVASCSAGYSPILSMANSEGSDETNAHVGNYSTYTYNVCCQIGNSPPTVPTLLYPANGNDSVFERTIDFDWTDSSDPDNDPITYTFNLTQATCADHAQTGIGDSNYTRGVLCVDQVYYWRVKACDAGGCSAWSEEWNFTIASTIGLLFTTNLTNFGELNRTEDDNTTDGSPPPFTVLNTGNVAVNVTLQAEDALYDTVALGNDAFRFKAREDEAGAYGAGSQTTWANVPAAPATLYQDFDYADSADSAFIDILVDIPYNEPAGYKSSIINITGSYG